jgi:CHASE2 domain-containing sensor protein
MLEICKGNCIFVVAWLCNSIIFQVVGLCIVCLYVLSIMLYGWWSSKFPFLPTRKGSSSFTCFFFYLYQQFIHVWFVFMN